LLLYAYISKPKAFIIY